VILRLKDSGVKTVVMVVTKSNSLTKNLVLGYDKKEIHFLRVLSAAVVVEVVPRCLKNTYTFRVQLEDES
jgi:hypothetical protein